MSVVLSADFFESIVQTEEEEISAMHHKCKEQQ